MQQPVHRRRTAARAPGDIAQAAPLQNNSLNHQALAGLQSLQLGEQSDGSLMTAGLLGIAGGQVLLLQPQPLLPGPLLLALPLVQAQAQDTAEIDRRGHAAQLDLQDPLESILLLTPFLQAPRLAYQGGRITQVVEDRPSHVAAGIGAERYGQAPVVELGGPDQAQQPHLLEILTGFR